MVIPEPQGTPRTGDVLGSRQGCSSGSPQGHMRGEGFGPASGGSLRSCEELTVWQIPCAQDKRPEVGSGGRRGRCDGQGRAEEGASTLGHGRPISKMTCPTVNPPSS